MARDYTDCTMTGVTYDSLIDLREDLDETAWALARGSFYVRAACAAMPDETARELTGRYDAIRAAIRAFDSMLGEVMGSCGIIEEV